MKIGKMGKLIFFVVVIGLLIVLGVFLWRFYNPDIGLVYFDEFKIQQTANAKIISHSKTGFSVSIPSDWEILDSGNSFSIKGSGLVLNEEMSRKFLEPVPQKGCFFDISIEKGEQIKISNEDYSEYQDVIDMINICSDDSLEFDCGYQVETINNIKVLKAISGENIKELSGKRIRIQMPKNNNVYIFEGFLFGDDTNRCEEEFDKILETVKIK